LLAEIQGSTLGDWQKRKKFVQQSFSVHLLGHQNKIGNTVKKKSNIKPMF